MPLTPMGAIPAWQARRRPGAIAAIHGADVLSWEALARGAARRARSLQAFGVGHNDVVTVALGNGSAFLQAVYGVWAAGATPHPVSARLPEAELSELVALARPKVLIGGALKTTADTVVLPWDWSAQEQSDDLIEGDDVAVADHWKIISSGGSTGRPKLILDAKAAKADPEVHDYHARWETHQGRLGHVGSVVLNPGPLHHNGPFNWVLRNLMSGSTLVGMVRFDAEEVLRLIERHRVEFVYLVPTMMLRIWRLPPEVRTRYDLSSLVSVLHMAAPCPPWLKAAWIDWLGPERVWETYGSTEAHAFTMINGGEWLAHPGSVGRFQNGRVRVTDSDGADLPPGEIGELWMMPDAGPGTTYRYIGAEPRALEGWESVGDMGSVDEDGYVHLADRRTDMILRGGVNIYPAEVEAALEAQPGVLGAVVIGLPDPDLGAHLHALVQVEPGRRPPAVAGSRLALSERLAPHKAPASFEFTTEPLRDEAGKTRRAQLRAERLSHIA